jgi:hypothetical protein
MNGQFHTLAALPLVIKKALWYLLDRMLGGPQSWSGHSGKKENPWFCCNLNPGHAGHRRVSTLTKLSWLDLLLQLNVLHKDENYIMTFAILLEISVA